jgi:hypothetical protein
MDCEKCDKRVGPYAYGTLGFKRKNLPLATSLDAWREHIWPTLYERLGDAAIPLLEDFDDALWKIKADNGFVFLWELEPLHHLEAAMSAANLKWEDE